MLADAFYSAEGFDAYNKNISSMSASEKRELLLTFLFTSEAAHDLKSFSHPFG
jgi:hypothetical protein